MKKLALCTLTLALMTGAPLFAEDAPKPDAPKGDHPKMDPEAIFKKLDTNSDGKVSLEEFKASPRAQKDPAAAEARFKEMDTDKDGFLSLDEFKAGAGHHKHHDKGDKKPA